MGSRFAAGVTIVRREMLHGRSWLEHPVTVVDDDDGEVLAVRLDPGSPFTFPQHPFGTHPWAPQSAWGGAVVLMLLRADTAYGVWKFFDPDGRFQRWYLNFEPPSVRRAEGYETGDHGLDLVIEPDGSRRWKDVEDLHHQRVEGRLGTDQVLAVLAAAAQVEADLDAGRRWWSRWDDWVPGV